MHFKRRFSKPDLDNLAVLSFCLQIQDVSKCPGLIDELMINEFQKYFTHSHICGQEKISLECVGAPPGGRPAPFHQFPLFDIFRSLYIQIVVV